MMDNKWRNACKKLQNERVNFQFGYHTVNNRWWFNFDKNLSDYQIAQQSIPDRPDWREWCRNLRNECGVKFERFSDNTQEWRKTKCYFDGYALSHYRIAQQPVPEQIINYLQEEQMTEKIMMDGEPLEVGDPVYCLTHGSITFNGMFGGDFPLGCMTHDGREISYTKNFTYYRDGSRTLYWQKPEITPPPKPKKKVKVWDWFIEYKDGSIVRKTGRLEDLQNFFQINLAQKIEGTEREIDQ